MYCLGYAERPHPGTQLSFMLHELVFWDVIRSSHRILTRLHRCEILQPYVAATMRMHSDAIFPLSMLLE